MKPVTAGAPARSRRLTCRSVSEDPSDPLFLHDGLDDGVSGTSRIAEHATIRIVRPLPPNIRIAEDPSATSVVLLRGIPSDAQHAGVGSGADVRPPRQNPVAIRRSARSTITRRIRSSPPRNSWR